MIEHDAQRRQQYWTARTYFSICNTTTGEILSEIAIRKRDVVLGKTQETAARNLKFLERFMADHRDALVFCLTYYLTIKLAKYCKELSETPH